MRIHLSAIAVLILLVSSSTTFAQTAWGIWNNDLSGASIVTFDVDAPGTVTVVGTTGIPGTAFINSLDFGPTHANLYLATNAATDYLYDVNITTGAASNARGSGLATGDTLGDLSYDHFAGRMLGLGSTGVAGGDVRLYGIDLSTGNATNLGTIGNLTEGYPTSLAVRPSDGLIFVHGIETDRWYTVNPVTLQATPLDPLGWNTNFGQGASFEPVSNVLYHAMLTTDGGNQNRLVTINQATGLPTFLGTLGTGLTQIGDIAFHPLGDLLFYDGFEGVW